MMIRCDKIVFRKALLFLAQTRYSGTYSQETFKTNPALPPSHISRLFRYWKTSTSRLRCNRFPKMHNDRIDEVPRTEDEGEKVGETLSLLYLVGLRSSDMSRIHHLFSYVPTH